VILHASPPLSFALENLGVEASVVTECNLPIGAGFGLSAAALLATLTAANRLFGLGLSGREIALRAHEAEVVHRTGLGDVAACQGGGRVVRKGPGIDAEIERRFDISEPLFSVCFGPILTPTVLGSPGQMARVAGAFPEDSPENPAEFFALSRRFARESGLMTPEAEEVVSRCEEVSVHASMTMLGNGVFACGPAAKHVLSRFGRVYEFRMAEAGARITGETS
jgi:pantoate kinase